jgi:hypothetical protein
MITSFGWPFAVRGGARVHHGLTQRHGRGWRRFGGGRPVLGARNADTICRADGVDDLHGQDALDRDDLSADRGQADARRVPNPRAHRPATPAHSRGRNWPAVEEWDLSAARRKEQEGVRRDAHPAA